MGFTEAVGACWKKSFKIKGRAARSEYWWFALFYVLTYAAVEVLGTVVPEIAVIGAIVYVAALVPMTTAGVRRLHDRGWSGWWIGGQTISTLMLIVLAVGGGGLLILILGSTMLLVSIVVLIQLMRRGQEGENAYGPSPLTMEEKA